MNTRRIFLAVLLVPMTASGANFCVVLSHGEPNCSYLDAESCQSAARTLRGQCVVNPSTFSPSRSESLYDNFQKGREAGERRRQWEEWTSTVESRALTKQADITYICKTAENNYVETKTPAVGCVVSSVK